MLEPDDQARLEDPIDAARRGRMLAAALGSLRERDREFVLLVVDEECAWIGAGQCTGTVRVLRSWMRSV